MAHSCRVATRLNPPPTKKHREAQIHQRYSWITLEQKSAGRQHRVHPHRQALHLSGGTTRSQSGELLTVRIEHRGRSLFALQAQKHRFGSIGACR